MQIGPLGEHQETLASEKLLSARQLVTYRLIARLVLLHLSYLPTE